MHSTQAYFTAWLSSVSRWEGWNERPISCWEFHQGMLSSRFYEKTFCPQTGSQVSLVLFWTSRPCDFQQLSHVCCRTWVGTPRWGKPCGKERSNHCSMSLRRSRLPTKIKCWHLHRNEREEKKKATKVAQICRQKSRKGPEAGTKRNWAVPWIGHWKVSAFLTCFLFYEKEKSPTSSPQLKKQKVETAPKDTLEKINVVIPIVLPGALRHPGWSRQKHQ